MAWFPCSGRVEEIRDGKSGERKEESGRGRCRGGRKGGGRNAGEAWFGVGERSGREVWEGALPTDLQGVVEAAETPVRDGEKRGEQGGGDAGEGMAEIGGRRWGCRAEGGGGGALCKVRHFRIGGGWRGAVPEGAGDKIGGSGKFL